MRRRDPPGRARVAIAAVLAAAGVRLQRSGGARRARADTSRRLRAPGRGDRAPRHRVRGERRGGARRRIPATTRSTSAISRPTPSSSASRWWAAAAWSARSARPRRSTFLALPDGATIPIFMAPPERLLPGRRDDAEARGAPLVARAGGRRARGRRGRRRTARRSATAEHYDPATATFCAVVVPRGARPGNGFVGRALATLARRARRAERRPRSRVIAVFDPATDAFGETELIVERRAFHGAIAIDDDARADHRRLHRGRRPARAAARRARTRTSTTPTSRASTNAARTDAVAQAGPARRCSISGVQRDGRRALRAGGRRAGGGRAGSDGGGPVRARGADGGGDRRHARAGRACSTAARVLTAFAADEATASSGAASVIAPGADPARPVTRGTAAAPACGWSTLEDGRVLAFGGDQPDVLRYDPTAERVAGAAVPGDAVAARRDRGAAR